MISWVMLLTDSQIRARVLPASAVLSLLVVSYGAMFWHAEGPLAMPIYAFRSVIEPDQKKVTSNLFREVENINIEHTIQRSPLFGLGFGQRYFMWIEVPSLDGDFTYWRYITHNAIYWVWIKLGAIGFVAFWYLIGAGLVLGCLVFRRLPSGELKAVTLMVVRLIAMQTIFSYGDMGLTSGRNMAYIGAWMGVLASLDRLAPAVAPPRSGERRRSWRP